MKENIQSITNFYEKDLLPDFFMNCQYVEEALKELIISFHKIITDSVAGKFSYKYNENDIRQASMGRLVKWFRAFCSDENLMKDLVELTKNRNELSHRGYTAFQSLEKDYSILKAWVEEANIANGKASLCHVKLKEMHEKLGAT